MSISRLFKILKHFTTKCKFACVLRMYVNNVLSDPPNRSSLWRFNYTASVNNKDDQNYCGGITVRNKASKLVVIFLFLL